MSIFDALARVPKVLEANVNAAIHPDPKSKSVVVPNTEPKKTTAAPQGIKPSTTDVKPQETRQEYVKPKDVTAAVSDLEKELMDENNK